MHRRYLRAAAAVPVVAAATLISVHLASPARVAAPAPAAGVEPQAALPDGSLVPDRGFELPATVSPAREPSAATDGRFVAVSARPSAGDIPAVSLAAYQRAESIVASADAACRLPWQLIAAVARIESDHGRFDGAKVDARGISRPSIIGPALDGRNGTALIRDTDGGLLDGDGDLDRAVGPLQFIPTTWSVVGVDGDNDGIRNPQDVDDAALGAAVYLCSGGEDLRVRSELRAAVYRYNHSTAYVDTVLAVMDDYLAGNAIVPLTTTVSAGALVPLQPLSEQGGTTAPDRDPGRGGRAGATVSAGPRGGDDGREDDDRKGPRAEVVAQPTPQQPEAPVEPTEPVPTEPVPTEPVPTEPVPTEPVPTEPVPTEPAPEPEPVPEPAPAEPSDEAVEQCTAEGYVDDPTVSGDDFDACVTAYDDAAGGFGDVPAETPDPTPAAALREETALPVD
jgi:membrane-bound lytic murein transglycosylase B